MQRTLAYALSPAPGLPLRFLLAAPWFGVLAALALLAAGEHAFVSRWSAPTLGITHLLTLGYLGMAMAGSMLQLIPVVTGVALPCSRAGAALVWLGLALGAVLLAAALGCNAGALLLPAAALLALSLAAFMGIVARALVLPAAAPAMPMVRGMRLAVAGLAVTVALGVTLALALSGALGDALSVPVLRLANLHAAWGLLGWVAMLVVGVAFQVIPMFQSSRLYPAPVARWAPWLLFALLAAWSGGAPWAPVCAALLCVFLFAFAVFSARLLATRRRKESDATTLYWRLALASLGACALLFQLPPFEQAPLAIGIVFIAGFALGVVNGMLYKIVPFLLWYHLQQEPAANKGDVPSIRAILPDAQGRRQFWCHAAALACLLAALYVPHSLARPAAVLTGLACLMLARDLWCAARRCRTVRAAIRQAPKLAPGACR
jgi:hypothetical protein